MVLLRGEISHLLARVENLNVAGSAIQFNKLKARAEISVAAENLAESAEGAQIQQERPNLDETMLRMIKNDPAEAVIFAWKELQSVMVTLADKNRIWVDLRSIRKAADQLSEARLIPVEMADAIKSLYSTYKSAMHSYDFTLDFETLVEYVRLTIETRQAIEKQLLPGR